MTNDILNKDISIKLSQPNYWQGNLINGVVELNANVSLRDKELIVKIKGVEKTRLKIPPKDMSYTQKRVIFTESMMLLGGNILGTKCNYPFSYTLPPILPGTFSLEEGSANYGLIYYYATATLTSKNQKKTEQIKHRTPFKILEKLNIPFARPVFVEQSNNSLPYFSSLSAKMWIDRNVYFPGETVLARLKINSTCVKPMQNITINLVQETEIKASGQKSQDISVVHSENQIPDLEPCYLGVRWVPLTIPHDTPLSSTLGALVRVNYFVQVKFDHLLMVSVPVTILIRQFFESEHSIRPPTAVLPPPTQIRPPWQPDNKAQICSGCNTKFGLLLLYKSHCRNCGKVFCRECVATKIQMPKLKYKEPARVCKYCENIVAETGGVKCQSPRKVLEVWHQQYSPNWIPLYKSPKK